MDSMSGWGDGDDSWNISGGWGDSADPGNTSGGWGDNQCGSSSGAGWGAKGAEKSDTLKEKSGVFVYEVERIYTQSSCLLL